MKSLQNLIFVRFGLDGGKVTKLGRYAIYENGHSPKEKSQYFSSYDDIKEVIEKLV